MRKLLLASVAALVLAVSPIALAQHHGGGGGGHFGGGGGMGHFGGGGGMGHFGGGGGMGHFGGGGPPGGGWRPPGGGGGPLHALGPHGPRPSSGLQRFGQPGPRFSERHFRGRAEFFRHRHIHVFIAGGPGWIWCDDSSWWDSPWWWDYCGDYGYDY
ncbi:MAG TPA: hypothetical protein VGJ20_16000 [Xanthobacteraceae bacterium]